MVEGAGKVDVLPRFMESAPEPGAALPPPTYVRYIPQGEITNAWRCPEDIFGPSRPRARAKRAGLAYQNRILDLAAGLARDALLVRGPWYSFSDSSDRRHYCQPDFILDLGPRIIVGEIKLRWNLDAWWQLRRLYLPVIRRALVGRDVVLVPLTICGSYDPAVSAPEPCRLVDGLFEAEAEHFNVWVVR